MIRCNDDIFLIRFKDIGRVEIGVESNCIIVCYNGKLVIGIGISKFFGVNIIEVVISVKIRMKELFKDFFDGMEYYVSVDYLIFVEVVIKEVWKSL